MKKCRLQAKIFSLHTVSEQWRLGRTVKYKAGLSGLAITPVRHFYKAHGGRIEREKAPLCT
jgi:hypothetical protein